MCCHVDARNPLSLAMRPLLKDAIRNLSTRRLWGVEMNRGVFNDQECVCTLSFVVSLIIFDVWVCVGGSGFDFCWLWVYREPRHVIVPGWGCLSLFFVNLLQCFLNLI